MAFVHRVIRGRVFRVRRFLHSDTISHGFGKLLVLEGKLVYFALQHAALRLGCSHVASQPRKLRFMMLCLGHEIVIQLGV
jgi:hypothetical protein